MVDFDLTSVDLFLCEPCSSPASTAVVVVVSPPLVGLTVVLFSVPPVVVFFSPPPPFRLSRLRVRCPPPDFLVELLACSPLFLDRPPPPPVRYDLRSRLGASTMSGFHLICLAVAAAAAAAAAAAPFFSFVVVASPKLHDLDAGMPPGDGDDDDDDDNDGC